MGAFLAENEGSTVTYIVGFIFLMLIGIGAKWMADYSDSPAPSGSGSLRAELLRGQQKLIKLDYERVEKECLLEDFKKLRSRVSEVGRIKDQLEVLSSELAEHHRSVGEILKSTVQTEADFREYRQGRRISLRLGIQGEKVELLELPSGRTFKNVIIRKADEVGIRIHHESGTARIEAADLPVEWRKRLDFDLGESRAALTQEKERLAARDQAILKAQKKIADGKAPNKQALTSKQIQIEITSVMRKRDEARLESRKSAAKSRYSRTRSGPEGLETWEQRATRYERIARAYESKLAILMSMLKD